MNHPFTNQFMKNNKDFLLETMMGPNAMRVSEELASFLALDESMRVLDLGCGAGISSILFAKKFGAIVYAADLWISPTDNYRRFEGMELGNKVIPLSVDVTKGLPFAQEYFDVIFCVDAYHYFGHTPDMLPFLLSFVKKGGYVAVAVPGLKKEFSPEMPEELKPFVPEDANFHTCAWWQDLWSKADDAEIVSCREMDCHKQAWSEWLESPNPYAVRDIDMMKAEDGKYFNHVQIIARRR